MPPINALRVLDAIGDPVLIVCSAGRIAHVNQTARTVLPGLEIGSTVLPANGETVATFLSRCRGSVRPLPGRLSIVVEGAAAAFRCTGSRLDADVPPPTASSSACYPRRTSGS